MFFIDNRKRKSTLVFTVVLLSTACQAPWTAGGLPVNLVENAREVRFEVAVDKADVIVYAEVVKRCNCYDDSNSADCPAGVAWGMLHPFHVYRGSVKDTAMKVFLKCGSGLRDATPSRRYAVGAVNSRGIYTLQRDRDLYLPLGTEDEAYVDILPELYVPHTDDRAIRHSVALNLLLGVLPGSFKSSDLVIRCSRAIRLIGLMNVRVIIDDQVRSGPVESALNKCILLNSYFGKPIDCSGILRSRFVLTTAQSELLQTSAREGADYVSRVKSEFQRTGTVILQGLLNASPGGACEVMQMWSMHDEAETREFALKARLSLCKESPLLLREGVR